MRYTPAEREREYRRCIKRGCTPEDAEKLVQLLDDFRDPESEARKQYEAGMAEWNEALRPMLKKLEESTLNVNYNMVINTR